MLSSCSFTTKVINQVMKRIIKESKLMNLGRERINKLKEQNKNPKDYIEKIRENGNNSCALIIK